MVVQCQMVSWGKYGGSSGPDMTRRILVGLLSDDIAVQYSFKGGKGKRKFNELACWEIIKGRPFKTIFSIVLVCILTVSVHNMNANLPANVNALLRKCYCCAFKQDSHKGQVPTNCGECVPLYENVALSCTSVVTLALLRGWKSILLGGTNDTRLMM